MDTNTLVKIKVPGSQMAVANLPLGQVSNTVNLTLMFLKRILNKQSKQHGFGDKGGTLRRGRRIKTDSCDKSKCFLVETKTRAGKSKKKEKEKRKVKVNEN